MSSGGTAMTFKAGRSAASGANVGYITREAATQGEREALIVRGVPEYVREGAGDYPELRSNLKAWAQAREQTERAAHGNRQGQARTHYRAVLSYEEQVPLEVAKAGAEEWLEERFPESRAVAAVHRDTGNTHVHVWIDARRVSGAKLHFGHAAYRSLDESWNAIYSRQMGRDPGEHLRKKEQTKQFKQALAKGRLAKGREAERRRPERAPRPGPEVYQARRERAERQEAELTGERAFSELARKHASRHFREAGSWDELSGRLGRMNLRVEAKGRGGALRSADGSEEVKLSAIDRDFSRGKLEQKFGETHEHFRERQTARRELSGVDKEHEQQRREQQREVGGSVRSRQGAETRRERESRGNGRPAPGSGAGAHRGAPGAHAPLPGASPTPAGARWRASGDF